MWRLRRQGRVGFAVAVVAIALAAYGGVAAALHLFGNRAARLSREMTPGPQQDQIAKTHHQNTETPEDVPAALPPPRAAPVEPAADAASHSKGRREDRLSAEVRLLDRATAAYTRREFSAALALVEEHERRFRSGRLAEQREALRVRSLFGADRVSEANRAAAAFAHRFPRSVLLHARAHASDQ